MNHLRIAVVLESLGLPLRRALDVVPRIGASGVQFDAVGDLSPDALSTTGRREIRYLLRSRGLELAALGCPLRGGLDEPAGLEARLTQLRSTMSLAYELGASTVVAALGRLITGEEGKAAEMVATSLGLLSQYGDKVGARLATVPAREPPASVALLLQSLPARGLGVTIDPANLVMRAEDPAAAVRTFSDFVFHVMGRDARLERVTGESLEVPLGHGDVDWNALLGTLEEIGYRGWLALRRGSCPNPQGDLAAGVQLLRRLGG